MPWQIDGSFLRITNNTQEEGADRLWQQDLSASIKIIASRHDFHDHDLAVGIENSLHTGGYNKMLADLDMNLHKINNLADATGLDEIPRYGQCIGSMTWDTPNPGDLRILDRDGNVVDTVNIPTGGGGGTGTVTAITIGAGLESSANPIQTTADLALETLPTPGQSYSGGIAGIVIDDHGRVTQVTTGAFANTNLGHNRGADTVEITSSTGSNTTIPEATESLAGMMTANQVQTLNSLSTGGGDPDQNMYWIAGDDNGIQLFLSRTGQSADQTYITGANPLQAGAMTAAQAQELIDATTKLGNLPDSSPFGQSDIANGYCDLSSVQTIGGTKFFSSLIQFDNGIVSPSAAQCSFAGPVTMSGQVEMTSLPTSDPGNPGELWNDGGTVKVSL